MCPEAAPAQHVEAALKAVRAAKGNAERQRALDVLERAVHSLREQPRQPRSLASPENATPRRK